MKRICILPLFALALIACKKENPQPITTASNNVSSALKTAATVEEARNNPGIYEFTYVIGETAYKMDINISLGKDGEIISEPIRNHKDIEEFARLVTSKKYTVMESPFAFGYYLLYDEQEEPSDVQIRFNKHFSALVEKNMKLHIAISDEESAVSNRIYIPEPPAPSYNPANDPNMLPVSFGTSSYPDKKYLKKDHPYLNFYEHINFQGFNYAISYNSFTLYHGAPPITSYISYGYVNESIPYVGNYYNDKISSIKIDFNDGLSNEYKLRSVALYIYEHANYEGTLRTFTFMNPFSEGVTLGVNIHDLLMYNHWFYGSLHWNDNLSSFQAFLFAQN